MPAKFRIDGDGSNKTDQFTASGGMTSTISAELILIHPSQLLHKSYSDMMTNIW